MSNITGIIKTIRDIMRKDTGVDGDAQRISQMVWMLFMKIFADKEEEWEITIKGYKSPIPKKLKWQTWAANAEGLTGEALVLFINNELFPALKELDVTQNDQAKIVRAVFEDTYNYMKNGTLFRQVINEINKIDFNKSGDRHVFNDIYETILKELQSAGSSGEYYTPRAVTQFMVDIILTNPPFGGTEEDGTEQNFPQKFRTKETADLFLALIIKLLKPHGRAAVVLPDGTLFGEGVKTRLKEELLEKCNLHTIVRLPNGVFAPYTGIKTNILFFEKGSPTKEIWYFEHPYPEGVKNYNKNRPVDIKEFDLEKAFIYSKS